MAASAGAVKGELLTEYWEYTHRIFEWSDGGAPNMILDDGGDATLLMHLGSQAERTPNVLHHPGNEEEEVLFAAIEEEDGGNSPAGTPKRRAQSGASPRKRPQACTASIRWKRKVAPVPRDQRQ